MPSEIVSESATHEETVVISGDPLVKQSAFRHKSAKLSKEKVLLPRGSNDIKLQEKGKALKCRNLTQQTGSDQLAASGSSVPTVALGSYQKPWPGMKATGAEELVRHMLNVPGYLQWMERRDNVQEKALSVGVLEWGLLKKWTYHQKHLASGRARDSSTSCSESSSSSTSGSSTHSCQAKDGPLTQRKLSSLLNIHEISLAAGSQTRLVEEERMVHVVQISDSTNSSINISDECYQHHSAEHDVDSDHLGHHRHGNGKTKDSALRAISDAVLQSPETCTSASKFHRKSALDHNLSEAKDAESRRAEKDQHMHSTRDWPENQNFPLSRKKGGMWDHHRESVLIRHGGLASPTLHVGMATKRNSNGLSCNLPEDLPPTDQFPHVPQSCPLPCTIPNDEPCTADTLSKNKFADGEPKGRNGKNNQVPVGSCPQFSDNMANRSCQGGVKATIARGRKSESYRSSAGLNWVHRTSSLKEGSPAQQLRPITCPKKSNEDKATPNNRGRVSPLRRILDPLLKPKNHITCPRPLAASPIQHYDEQGIIDKPLKQEKLASSQAPCSSSHTSIDPLSRVSNKNGGTCHDERHAASTRQALLRLAWKNGLPLFMLSSHDSDVLAATVRKKNASDEDDFECIYTIFSVQEAKKKSGAWINSEKKSKKHGLASNVVGQMKVSHSKPISHGSKCHSAVREFVLVSPELLPTCQKSVDSPFHREIAAIVTIVPHERSESSNVDKLPSDHSRNSSLVNLAESSCHLYEEKCLKVEQNSGPSSVSCTKVIIPNGPHGWPTAGEPAPLIERWRSGGKCDCGGWDEGCRLTVLSDKFGESKRGGSVQACHTTDGTHRFELFFQGGTPDERPAFSMVSFKEGLYTVDFGASIALLQAFAICIATLHSRKSTGRSLERKSLQEHMFDDQSRDAAPAS